MSKQGMLIVESGEDLVGVEEKLKSAKSFRTKDGNRYDFLLSSIQTPIPHKIYLSLNSSKVSVELKNYLILVTLY